MRRFTQWTCAIILLPTVLLFLLVAALYIPPVQRWVAGRAMEYASRQTGMEITLDALHIAFPLDIKLGNLSVSQNGERMIGVKEATVDIKLCRILKKELVVEGLKLCEGDVCIHLSDSTEKDSTETEIPLILDIRDVALKRSHMAIYMPGDSVHVEGYIEDALAEGGQIDLMQGDYRVKKLAIEADSLCYSDLSFKDIGLDVRDLHFRQSDLFLSAGLNNLRLKEKSGIELTEMTCNILLSGSNIQVRDLKASTPYSNAEGNVNLDFSAITPRQKGRLEAMVKARIGYDDIKALALPHLPKEFATAYPQQPVIIDIEAEGNVDSLSIHKGQLTMPTVIDVRTDGHLTSLTDSLHMSAHVNSDIRTGDLSCLRHLPGMQKFRLPPMTIMAETDVRDLSDISTDLILTEGSGRMHLQGKADLKKETYQARASIRNLQVHDFLPHDSIYRLSASASIKGRGYDLLGNGTAVEAKADVERMDYGHWKLDSMEATAKLRKGVGEVEFYSNNRLLKMQACADATIRNRRMDASSFSIDLSHIDLFALGITPDTLTASMVAHIEGSSDFRQTHMLKASIDAMELQTKDTVFHPVELRLDAALTPRDITAKALAGDMEMTFNASHGLDSLLLKSKQLTEAWDAQIRNMRLEQDSLQMLLPQARLHIKCGKRNPVSNILKSAFHYTYSDLHFDLESSPQEGMSGDGYLYGLNTGAVLLDTIDWRISRGEKGHEMKARVKNGPKNKVVVFDSALKAALTSTGASAHIDFWDAQGKKGMDLGFQLDNLPDGMKIHFAPLKPIIAYRYFSLNADNFIRLTKNGRLEALVDLLADDGTGMKLYSVPNEDALQDISLSVNHFNLGELSQVLPYMPDIQGFLHGDFHYMQADSTTTISADMKVKEMRYKGTQMGDIGLNAVYFPNADGSHYIDGIVTQDDNEITFLTGRYWDANGTGMIDATASLNRLPFSLANAFIPDAAARMEGYAIGELEVKGRSSNPILTGDIATEGMHILAEAYNVDISVPDNTLRIQDSRIEMNRLEAYAAGKSPLVVGGSIDFYDLSKIRLDINLQAKDYQLINAPKTRNALAYGKVFVDLDSRLWGTLDNLRMRGRLNVLGNTDVSYVLKDSPITVHDELADIVTFCDFSEEEDAPQDTLFLTSNRIDMQLNIGIEQSAIVHCILSEDGSDYIDIQGGGDLSMTYDLQNELQLFGRYTIQQGTMRYSLMAIPLNDFQIASGSFVEFQGDILNPRLGISASERVKASVTENSLSRNVAFDVGLALSQTLKEMGLEFTVNAPEDMTIQNELTAMSAEDRGRVAVTMLVTGMYINSNSNIRGGFSYANTLNTYLQSAINKLAGQAISTIDVNLGIENSTTESGSTTTDYSFSFAKRFWGNRISLIVGGKVSTGHDAVNNGQTIIDNISLEYRLDKNSTRYVRLYYDRNYESLLEGELTEMGAGLVLRKKTEKLGELFLFRKKKPLPSALK